MKIYLASALLLLGVSCTDIAQYGHDDWDDYDTANLFDNDHDYDFSLDGYDWQPLTIRIRRSGYDRYSFRGCDDYSGRYSWRRGRIRFLRARKGAHYQRSCNADHDTGYLRHLSRARYYRRSSRGRGFVNLYDNRRKLIGGFRPHVVVTKVVEQQPVKIVSRDAYSPSQRRTSYQP